VALLRWRSPRIIELSSYRAAPVDADIDMRRPAPRRSLVVLKISRLLRWMMPEGNSMGRPMRSVVRELEEVFPSDDN
jgi:hypothetical protein